MNLLSLPRPFRILTKKRERKTYFNKEKIGKEKSKYKSILHAKIIIERVRGPYIVQKQHAIRKKTQDVTHVKNKNGLFVFLIFKYFYFKGTSLKNDELPP